MFKDADPNAVSRKKDHIELAFRAQLTEAAQDKRFYYEPLLASHSKNNTEKEILLFSFSEIGRAHV